jgi:hypothetical protein
MEITEAPEIPSFAETEEVPVELEVTEGTEGLEQEITKDIETGKKPKKPRTEAQKAAFMKAREALAQKRKAAAEEKVLNKKKPGRPRNPPKVKEEPVPATRVEKKEKKVKKVQYVLEESSSSSEEEEEIVYVKRSKGQRKPKKKQGQKVVYLSSSSEEEDLAPDTYDYSKNYSKPPLPLSQPAPQQLSSLYSFV